MLLRSGLRVCKAVSLWAVVVLLTSVSWLTFTMDPSDLSSRASVALTLLLAIGVFQLILNVSAPGCWLACARNGSRRVVLRT